MSVVENIRGEVAIARRELKNIRQEIMKLKADQKKEIEKIKQLLLKESSQNKEKENINGQNEKGFNMIPIGYMSSCFKNKNGTPRQPALCQTSKASLSINKTFFTNPEHSLTGLNDFSYIWVLFIFHKNNKSSIKAKVHPPRLNGASIGVFSTRSPHRPCAIGLSLTKIEKIIGNTIFLSGVDILDGTPVLDIKPYIPSYDIPPSYKEFEYFSKEVVLRNSEDVLCSPEKCVESSSEISSCIYNEDEKSTYKSTTNNKLMTGNSTKSISELLNKPSNSLEVLFTERALKDIENFHFPRCDSRCDYCLNFIDSPSSVKQAVSEILQNDPRSVYRRNKCSDKLYFFEVDNLHITCWFDDMIAEVLRVKPVK